MEQLDLFDDRPYARPFREYEQFLLVNNVFNKALRSLPLSAALNAVDLENQILYLALLSHIDTPLKPLNEALLYRYLYGDCVLYQAEKDILKAWML